jgi:dihydroxyacid dehydratase/phosphogluconate dehydratase
MEETYQITGALKHVPFGKHVTLITDARFSGVSTGACLGHVGPEGLAGGPIGKVLDGDIIRVILDRKGNAGTVDLVGDRTGFFGVDEGTRVLQQRPLRADLSSNPSLPDDTKLWAMLQTAGGGTWGGCVYDTEQIGALLAERRTRLT